MSQRNIADPLLLPRRPDRTSELREPPRRAGTKPRTDLTVFHTERLNAPGMTRRISLHAREGDEPCVMIGVFRADGSCATRLLIHRRSLPPVVKAVTLARTTRLETRRHIGSIALSAGMRCAVSVAEYLECQGVSFQMINAAGMHVGKAKTLIGVELEALGRACAALAASS